MVSILLAPVMTTLPDLKTRNTILGLSNLKTSPGNSSIAKDVRTEKDRTIPMRSIVNGHLVLATIFCTLKSLSLTLGTAIWKTLM